MVGIDNSNSLWSDRRHSGLSICVICDKGLPDFLSEANRRAMLYRCDELGRVEGQVVVVHSECWDEGERRALAQGMLWWVGTDPRIPSSRDFQNQSGRSSRSKADVESPPLSRGRVPITGWSRPEDLDPKWLYERLESTGDLLGDLWIRIEPTDHELRLGEDLCSHLPDDLRPGDDAVEYWRDPNARMVLAWTPNTETLILVPMTGSADHQAGGPRSDPRIVAHLRVHSSTRRAWATLWKDGNRLGTPGWFGSGQPGAREG